MSEEATVLWLVNGARLTVEQTQEDAARLLWGHKDGDDAHDTGFASLVVKRRNTMHTVRVNPSAVMFVAPEVVVATTPRLHTD